MKFLTLAAYLVTELDFLLTENVHMNDEVSFKEKCFVWLGLLLFFLVIILFLMLPL